MVLSVIVLAAKLMTEKELHNLVDAEDWSTLEQGWLSAIEKPDADVADLLAIIDELVKAGQAPLASTMAWAWLSTAKENRPPKEALQLGRALLLRLPDGAELREEILDLYRETHTDWPGLETWIERSGLTAGKPVRRALRFLEVGLRLRRDIYLTHRAENEAARLIEFDVEADTAVIQTPRRRRTFDIVQLIEEYDVAAENDFRVLIQFEPERLVRLLNEDPVALTIGILRCHANRIDRDALKLMLVPRYLPSDQWTEWWGRLRDGVKRSRNLRIEGRSPMFLIYDEVGQSEEAETWTAFSQAQTPREWLDAVESYLREKKRRKAQPDPKLLNRIQAELVDRVERLTRHQDRANAFAAALVIERLASEGLPISTDPHGMALKMLSDADPVSLVAALPDARLWPLALDGIEQAKPAEWPQIFAELLLLAPVGQCDAVAKRIEAAGRGDLLPVVVQRATADPGQYTDAMIWLWKGPLCKTVLPIPPPLEMLTDLLALVGPARLSAGKNVGQSVAEMRAKVRAGLTAKGGEKFRQCVAGLDPVIVQTLRRQVERADGLGPSAQEDLGHILYQEFPQLYLKPRVAIWEDDTVMYFTQAGYDARQAELDDLVNVKMRENAKAIGEAAAHGDLSENSEYKFALEERDLLRARLAQLNREVSLARVLERHDVPDDHVSIGQRITLRPTNGDNVVMTILGANDGDVANRIYSYLTPLAKQILGRRLGDRVTVAFEGNEAEFVIERIECAI